jgi:hypothetical protein
LASAAAVEAAASAGFVVVFVFALRRPAVAVFRVTVFRDLLVFLAIRILRAAGLWSTAPIAHRRQTGCADRVRERDKAPAPASRNL